MIKGLKKIGSFDPETLLRFNAGLLQGCLLLAMHLLIEKKVWPATSQTFLIVWYTAVILVPVTAELLIRHFQDRRFWSFILVLGTVLAGLSFYTGRLLSPHGGFGDQSGILFPFGVSVALGWFVALPFAQSWLARKRRDFPYPDLFEYSWNNMMTLIIAGFFTQIFWGLLWLWAGMFMIIKIEFFKELFTSTYFVYPATASAFGFAVSYGRANGKLVTGLRNIILIICRALLPLPAFIGILFLAALPFKGIQRLWDTGHATFLMLNLQLCVILFLNAVTQDGRKGSPYHPWIQRLVEAGVIVLPAYAGLSLYALWLRIDQHGWSADRVYAAAITFITGLYALGYSICALRREFPWMKSVSPINVRMAFVVIILSVVLNTPVLDPRRIAVRSQVNRLLKGAVDADKFDYDYLRFSLGNPGRMALQELAGLQGHPHGEIIRAKAETVLAKEHRWDPSPAALTDADHLKRNLALYPEGKEFDPGFLAHLISNKQTYQHWITDSERKPVVAVDLNGDGTEEMVLFSHNVPYFVFLKEDGRWREAGKLVAGGGQGWCAVEERDKILAQKGYRVEPSGWDVFVFGQTRYVLAEEE
ncbi:MAG: DUF4153 domain-containing protein [Candidatus Omnitrophica bacterium]|nr:DUF4153 domain-containing protein [Candidatus Omnitrophota bacterium]